MRENGKFHVVDCSHEVRPEVLGSAPHVRKHLTFVMIQITYKLGFGKEPFRNSTSCCSIHVFQMRIVIKNNNWMLFTQDFFL